jgi:hypothetical protein
MTTRLPIPHATDEDVIDALADYMRESRVAALRGAWPIIVARLSDRFGRRLVDRAVYRYMRELRRENRSLERQVARAKADWLKRQ